MKHPGYWTIHSSKFNPQFVIDSFILAKEKNIATLCFTSEETRQLGLLYKQLQVAKEGLPEAQKALKELEKLKWQAESKKEEKRKVWNLTPIIELDRKIKELENQKIDFWENKEGFEKQLRSVISALIAQPIATDIDTFTLEEITQDLQDLKIGYAYVKTSSGTYSMQTTNIYTDLNYRAVSIDEAMARRNTIINQTKKKYCRGRAEIDAEIDAVYTPPAEKPPETPPPTSKPSKSHKEDPGYNEWLSALDPEQKKSSPPVVKPQQQPAKLDRYDDLKEFDNVDF